MNRQIELSSGFEELRRSLDDFGEAKKWKETEEKKGEKKQLGINYRQYKKKLEMMRGRCFRKGGRMVGSRVQTDTTGNK